jgi:hypothetical protein
MYGLLEGIKIFSLHNSIHPPMTDRYLETTVDINFRTKLHQHQNAGIIIVTLLRIRGIGIH